MSIDDSNSDNNGNNNSDQGQHQRHHEYHSNLPPTYYDSNGHSRMIQYARRKARALVRLVYSIRLEEEFYNFDYDGVNDQRYGHGNSNVNGDDVVEECEEDLEMNFINNHQDDSSLVRLS